MDKVLLYTNDFKDMESLIAISNYFTREGYEVAFSTDSWEIAKYMAIGFLTVVKVDTYYPNVVITNENLNVKNRLTIEEAFEVVESE